MCDLLRILVITAQRFGDCQFVCRHIAFNQFGERIVQILDCGLDGLTAHNEIDDLAIRVFQVVARIASFQRQSHILEFALIGVLFVQDTHVPFFG